MRLAVRVCTSFRTAAKALSQRNAMATLNNAEAGPSRSPSPPRPIDPVSLPARGTAAEKWYNPLGPPVGSTFGARTLKEEEDVFSQNAWDHVELPEDFQLEAEKIKEQHRSSPVQDAKRDLYNTNPANHWNKFYAVNKDQFFKDRAWLRLEFPELIACSEADAGPKTVLEVGCGAGNTIFTLLTHNENPDLTVYATDYAPNAVELVKANPIYPVPPHGKGKLRASVWDISAGETLPAGLEPGTVDVITCIFCLSALHPNEWDAAIANLWTALRPGGLLLLRDYGRHDLAQLRMKKERLLDPTIPNLYIRGDGTRVYFFTKAELEGLLTAPSPTASSTTEQAQIAEFGGERSRSMFAIEQLGEDRRMLVNRKLQLKMYRIWMQVKARKTGGGLKEESVPARSS